MHDMGNVCFIIWESGHLAHNGCGVNAQTIVVSQEALLEDCSRIR